MPRLSCWFIRGALLYLAVGWTFGALMLLYKAVPLDPFLWRLFPAHLEFVLIGWTLHLTMGVAYAILPRFAEGQRGREAAAWAALVLLNLGVALAGLGPIVGAPALMVFTGRLAEAGAAVAFMIHAWPRIKPLGA